MTFRLRCIRAVGIVLLFLTVAYPVDLSADQKPKRSLKVGLDESKRIIAELILDAGKRDRPDDIMDAKEAVTFSKEAGFQLAYYREALFSYLHEFGRGKSINKKKIVAADKQVVTKFQDSPYDLRVNIVFYSRLNEMRNTCEMLVGKSVALEGIVPRATVLENRMFRHLMVVADSYSLSLLALVQELRAEKK